MGLLLLVVIVGVALSLDGAADPACVFEDGADGEPGCSEEELEAFEASVDRSCRSNGRYLLASVAAGVIAGLVWWVPWLRLRRAGPPELSVHDPEL